MQTLKRDQSGACLYLGPPFAHRQLPGHPVGYDEADGKPRNSSDPSRPARLSPANRSSAPLVSRSHPSDMRRLWLPGRRKSSRTLAP